MLPHTFLMLSSLFFFAILIDISTALWVHWLLSSAVSSLLFNPSAVWVFSAEIPVLFQFLELLFGIVLYPWNSHLVYLSFSWVWFTSMTIVLNSFFSVLINTSIKVFFLGFMSCSFIFLETYSSVSSICFTLFVGLYELGKIATTLPVLEEGFHVEKLIV